MNKKPLMALTLSALLLLSVSASADARHDKDRDDDGRHHQQEQRTHGRENPASWHRETGHDHADNRQLPFRWNERANVHASQYQMTRIHDRSWDNHFPGLHAYRWSNGEGFWHHGRHITDAVFFYDQHDRLVSIGYMNNGVFILIKQDNNSYENHDSFFFSWFHH